MSIKLKLTILLTFIANINLFAQCPIGAGNPGPEVVCGDSAIATFMLYESGDYLFYPGYGSDTICLNNVVANYDVSHTYYFPDCSSLPGNPDLENGLYVYNVLFERKDCNNSFDMRFKIAPNPIKPFTHTSLECLDSPYGVTFENHSCMILVENLEWAVNGIVQDTINTNFEHEFNGPGTYVVSLTLYTYANCPPSTYTETIVITANPQIDFEIAIDSTSLCDSIFTLQPTNNSLYATSYIWSSDCKNVTFSDSSAAEPIITVVNDNPPKEIEITLQAENDDCGPVSQDFSFTTFSGQQISIPDVISICEGTLLNIRDSIQFSPSPDSVFWEAPGAMPFTSSEPFPSFSYDAEGSYLITFYVTDACGNQTIESANVLVGPSATTTVSSPHTFCISEDSIGLSIFISSSASFFCQGDKVTGDCLFIHNGTVGTSLVEVVDECGAIDTIEMTITSGSMPVFPDMERCLNDAPISLDSLADGIFTGDLVVNNVFYPDSIGNFSILYQDSSETCGGMGVLEIAVVDFEAIIGLDTSSCSSLFPIYQEGQGVTFFNASGEDIVQWAILETNEVYSTESINIQIPPLDSIRLQLTVGTEGGCLKSVEEVIYIDPIINPSLQIDTVFTCEGAEITLTPSIVHDDYSYAWNAGGQTSNAATAAFSLAGAAWETVHPISLEMTTPCQSFSLVDTITLAPIFQVSFDVYPLDNEGHLFCPEDSIFFIPTWTQVDSIVVFFGDGSMEINSIEPHVYYNSGDSILTYEVVVVGYNQNCPPDTASLLINIMPEETVANFTIANSIFCAQESFEVLITSTPGSNSVIDFGDGTATATNTFDIVSHSYPDLGVDTTYTITIVSVGCGIDTFSQPVDIYKRPDLVIQAASQIACAGDFVQFTYTSDQALTDLVYTMGMDSFTQANPEIQFPVAGEFLVRVQGMNSNGCIGHDSISVLINPVPVLISLEVEDATACVGENFNISAIFEHNEQVFWTLSDGRSLVGDSISLVYLEPGLQTIMVQSVSPHGCLTSLPIPIEIEVFDIDVKIELAVEPLVELGETLELTAIPSNFPVAYNWSGENIDCNDCQTIEIQPLATAIYSVTATEINGCSAFDEILIEVAENHKVFIPNAFSPNADGLDDAFTAYGGINTERIVSMEIFSKSGLSLFEAYDIPLGVETLGWDGKYKGSPLPIDGFIYKMTIRFLDGHTADFVGDLTLIK